MTHLHKSVLCLQVSMATANCLCLAFSPSLTSLLFTSVCPQHRHLNCTTTSSSLNSFSPPHFANMTRSFPNDPACSLRTMNRLGATQERGVSACVSVFYYALHWASNELPLAVMLNTPRHDTVPEATWPLLNYRSCSPSLWPTRHRLDNTAWLLIILKSQSRMIFYHSSPCFTCERVYIQRMWWIY